MWVDASRGARYWQGLNFVLRALPNLKRLVVKHLARLPLYEGYETITILPIRCSRNVLFISGNRSCSRLLGATSG